MERREPDDSYSHVLKYTGIFGGVQGLKIVVALVRNKLTASLLGEVGMGLNKRFLNVSEILNSWTNFGLPFYAVRRISELYEEGSDDDLRRFVGVIRTWSVWSALLGSLLCFFLASWLSGRYFPSGESHTLEIMFLSVFVFSLPIEAVECALLKGIRRLRTVAAIEVFSALSTFLFTIPVYFLWGIRGVVLSLVLCGWSAALIHLFFSTRIYPYRIRLFSRSVLLEGWPLIRIGIPYVLAGVAAAMATGEVFRYLGGNSVIGLYSVGYGLMVTYAGMIFKAVDADFFPRLSSVNHDAVRLNHAINQQIDVCVLLIAPVLILFIIFMPLVIRLLYTANFLPAVPMAVCAVFYMFFKAVTTPMAYTSLAKGDSWMFLIMECIYDVVFVLVLRWGYMQMGLVGAGIALSVASLFDMLMIGFVYGFYYHIRLRRRTLGLILPQALLLGLTVVCAMVGTPLYKYVVGAVCLLVSTLFSWKTLSPQQPFIASLRERMNRKK
ncbi:MAG: oligosaccharide flippase family protein [Bacteroidaceae bacterium]|nr:oligosaccharide flippase family protein [Bacteroidaceae bacterium]MBR1788687.1 oligosaccharide flippase family protein [Bacteroidaceae bacterium]